MRSYFGEAHHKDWGVIDIDAQDAILKQLDLDDKSFQSWGMSPVYDFFSAMNVPKYMGLYRAGKKRDSLLFIISDLVDSMKPKRFYDVFGGTGAVSLAMSPKDYEVLNEYDICLFNFLVCVKYYPDELWEKCKELTAEIINHDYKKHVMYWNTWDYLFKTGENGKPLVEEKDLAIAFHFKLLNFVYDFLYKFNIAEDWKGRGKAPARYYDVLKNYKSTILGIKEPLKDTILPVIFNGMLEIAAHWYFLYSFSQQGYSEPSITVYRYEGFITWLDIIGAEIDEEAFAKTSCSLPAFSDIEDEKNDYIDMNIRSKHIIYKDEDKEKLDLFMVSKRLQSIDLISSDFHAVLNDADSYWVKTGNIGGNKSYGVSGKFTSVIDSYKCDCLSAKGWERKILPTEVEATPTSLGIKAMQSVISKPEDTLVYLDPPYFMTEQYDSAFPDKLHVDMIEWLRTTKCNWILSCKEDCTNEDEKGTIQSYRIDGGTLIKDFKDFFIGLARWFEIVEKKKIKGVDVDIIRGIRTGDILDGLYVYRELPCINSKTVDEIMIANFKIQEEATLDTFYLFWDEIGDRYNIQSKMTREDKIKDKVHDAIRASGQSIRELNKDEDLYKEVYSQYYEIVMKQKAYECIPFEEFLNSKGWY